MKKKAFESLRDPATLITSFLGLLRSQLSPYPAAEGSWTNFSATPSV